jgi:type I restriction enzyme S subunit
MFASITGKNLKEFKVNLPPLPEQKRIVDLISSVDSYIEALRQQLESAKRSKNAVLHELLTAGGDGWTETALGELINLSTGKLDVNAGKANGEYPFFTCAKEIYWINEHAFEGEAVLVAGNGDLNVKYYDGKFNAYQRTYVLFSKNSQRLAPRFLFLFMSSYINELRNSTQGSTIQYLKKNQFIDAEISLPPLPEQERIVDLISSMDDGISATEKLISQTKQMRSGLLSDLLSGEHEIPTSYDKVIGAA